MTILELKDATINSGLAYVLGLIFPLYKTGKNNKEETFIKGCINYNSITDEELAEHFKLVLNFLSANNLENIDVKSNKQDNFSISRKKGFSVLIWTLEKSDNECLDILFKKVTEIKNSKNNEIKKAFMKGCFDGRSSFDTTMHFVAVDTDRDYQRQDLIKSIFDDLDIDLNLNRREKDYEKNDQLRLKPKTLQKYLKEIDLYSNFRKQKIKNFIKREE